MQERIIRRELNDSEYEAKFSSAATSAVLLQKRLNLNPTPQQKPHHYCVCFKAEFGTSEEAQNIGGSSKHNNTSLFLNGFRAEICRTSQATLYNSSLSTYLPKINKKIKVEYLMTKTSTTLVLWREWIYTKEIKFIIRYYELNDDQTQILLFSGGTRSKKRKFNIESDCDLITYDLLSSKTISDNHLNKAKREMILRPWQLKLGLEIC